MIVTSQLLPQLLFIDLMGKTIITMRTNEFDTQTQNKQKSQISTENSLTVSKWR